MITLMKWLKFEEGERSQIALSDLDGKGWPTKIRLDPKLHCVQLMKSGAFYPLSPHLWAMTRLTRPRAVRRWVGFQADVVLPRTVGGGVSPTHVWFRLHDGTDQWYYHHTWVKGTERWNTEEEIADNISTFNALTARQLRVAVNLETSDPPLTPQCYGVRLAYEADLPSQQEDLIYRTFIPALKAGVRPVTDFVMESAGTTTIDLAALMVQVEAQHRVTGVQSVFDYTDDPSQLVNYYQSFNSTIKVITLSAPVTFGHTLLIRVIYEPVVVFETTDQDYVTVGTLPAIVLRNLNSSRSMVAGANNEVVNKGDATAFVFPEMMRMMYDCSLSTLTPSGVDQQRLHEEMTRFFSENRVMRTVGTDEAFDVLLRSEFVSATNLTPNEVHAADGSFSIENAYFQVERTQTSQLDGVYPVDALVFNGGATGRVSAPRYAAVITPTSIASAESVRVPTI